MAIRPEVLDALMKAGASAEMIVAAVKADAAIDLERDAERREKDRVRKREARAAEKLAKSTVASDMSHGRPRTSADTPPLPSLNDGIPSSSNVEGNLNPTHTPPIVPPAPKIATARDEQFERFRKAYPRRKGTDARPESRKAFDKAIRNGADPERLIAAAARFAQSEEGQRSEFVPMSATWLNKGRFDDYQAQHPAKPINGSDPKTWDELRWRRALNDARENGWSPSMGPMPGEPGSVVPRNLVGFGERFQRRGVAA